MDTLAPLADRVFSLRSGGGAARLGMLDDYLLADDGSYVMALSATVRVFVLLLWEEKSFAATDVE